MITLLAVLLCPDTVYFKEPFKVIVPKTEYTTTVWLIGGGSDAGIIAQGTKAKDQDTLPLFIFKPSDFFGGGAKGGIAVGNIDPVTRLYKNENNIRGCTFIIKERVTVKIRKPKSDRVFKTYHKFNLNGRIIK